MKGVLASLSLAAVIAVAVCSCTRGTKVIPVRKMERIYWEMFLADQWLADNPDKKAMADTTWFYAPIFERYGYNVEDYRKSVDHYLNDPKRYAEMMGRVVKGMEGEAADINARIAHRERLRHKADSLKEALSVYAPDDLSLYYDAFIAGQMTRRVEFRKNERGLYQTAPVEDDTTFRGPELIIRDTTVHKLKDLQDEIPR